MDYSYLKQLLDDNPAIKILRARNAPLILGFLSEAFKKTHKLVITNENLIIDLAAYLEEYEPDPDESSDTLERSRQLIEDWCHDRNRYLRKYPDAKGTVVHELTNYLEKVFRWLENLQPREYVGTDSRFNDILRRLDELVTHTTEDPQRKILDLQQKKQALEDEIREIETSGVVQTLERWQIRERFEEISSSSRDLLADFKEVELNFKKIVEHIYREETEKNPSRGEILGYTLDANYQLKESSQGKSFHSFWNFLVADAGEDKISSMVSRVFALLNEKNISFQDTLLKKLKYHLHQAGKRVIDSNHTLADKLNRVLTESNLLQRQRIKELIREITRIIFSLKDNPPDLDVFMEIDGNPEIKMDLERPLNLPPVEYIQEEVSEADPVFSPANLAPLFEQFYVDKKRLQGNIRQLLAEKQEVRLAEILARYPVRDGLAEIIIYYDLASTMKKADILADKYFFIVYDYHDVNKKIKAPEVIFYR